MHLLIGVPLAIFRLIFSFLMLAVRFLVPIAVIVVILLLLRSRRRQDSGSEPSQRREEQPPTFDGPVYTVDYEDVAEEPDDKGEGV